MYIIEPDLTPKLISPNLSDPVYPPIFLSFYLFLIYPSIFLSIYLLTYPSIHPSIHPSISLPLYLSKELTCVVAGGFWVGHQHPSMHHPVTKIYQNLPWPTGTPYYHQSFCWTDCIYQLLIWTFVQYSWWFGKHLGPWLSTVHPFLDNYQIAVRDWWQSLPLSTFA